MCVGAADSEGVDLSLPYGVPLVALLPEIVDLAVCTDDPGGDWQLSRLDGSALDHRMTLRELSVRDGELLVLSAAPAFPPNVEREDWVTRLVASATDTPVAAPKPVVPGSAIGVVGAVLCAVFPAAGLVPAATAAVVLGGVTVCAAMAARAQRPVTAQLAVLTMILAATTGVRAVPGPLSAAHGLLAATAAAVAALALARFRVGDTMVSVAVACGAALSALAALAAVAVPLPTSSAGAVLAAFSLAVLGGSARLSLLLAGLGRAAVDPDPTADADERAASGQRVLSGLVVGSSTAATLASAVAAAGTLQPGVPWTAAAMLCAAVGLVLLLRTRTYVSGRLRWTLMANGTCCSAIALTVAAGALPQHAHWVGAAAVCVALAVVTRGATTVAASPLVDRAFDVAEYVAIAAVPPLACAVTGLYGVVRDLVLT
ncbi:type VII secretion integral membrane protein EccD [Mycobacterium sp. WMMD1722]|uniref:type VII secretion integral membrane protein EccD n=1 Tax=Mycobacterium sp. WMMD1722 TaxID=3404117 RepID=UPI003BF599A7